MFSEKRINEIEHHQNSHLTEEELQKLTQHFFNWIDLPDKERKITEIFKKFKSKFSEENKGLFLLPLGHVYEPEDFRIFFEYERSIPLPLKKEYNFVYDCLNFVSYQQNYEPAFNEDDYIKKIVYDFSLLNEKGTLMILLDVYYTKNIFANLIKALGPEYKTKLFINFYFMEKYDFLFVVTIQKMSKVDTPINLSESKVLITDYFSNKQSHLLCSKLIKEIDKFLEESIIKMQNYYTQSKINYSQLSILHPGQSLQLKLKTSPLSENIDYILTITDCSSNLDGSNNVTVALAILYEMSQDLLIKSDVSFDILARNINVGRLITLECALLNPMNIKELAEELTDEVQLMKPDSFKGKVEIKALPYEYQKYLVYEGDNYLIRDCEEKDDLCFRQLFYNTDERLLNAVMAKIKIKYVSKSKIKNNDNNPVNFPMETQDKFKNKGVLKCIDENNIPGFYEKTIICMAFYLDLNHLPKNTIKIMSIGAGLGIMSFYLYRFFKGNCEIDNIEKNKWMHDIGIKYFGLKNYYKHSNRINWFYEDAKICLNKMNANSQKVGKYEDKIGFYDLIFNEINDINFKEFCSPSKSFFTDEFLENVKNLLKKTGIYLINVQTRSAKVVSENYFQLEKHFPTICEIPSEKRGLNYIFICYKEKLNEQQYGEIFSKNQEIIFKSGIVESKLVEPFYTDIISKIKTNSKESKIMEKNAKLK